MKGTASAAIHHEWIRCVLMGLPQVEFASGYVSERGGTCSVVGLVNATSYDGLVWELLCPHLEEQALQVSVLENKTLNVHSLLLPNGATC